MVCTSSNHLTYLVMSFRSDMASLKSPGLTHSSIFYIICHWCRRTSNPQELQQRHSNKRGAATASIPGCAIASAVSDPTRWSVFLGRLVSTVVVFTGDMCDSWTRSQVRACICRETWSAASGTTLACAGSASRSRRMVVVLSPSNTSSMFVCVHNREIILSTSFSFTLRIICSCWALMVFTWTMWSPSWTVALPEIPVGA